MLTIPEISKQYEWVKPIDQTEDEVAINLYSMCLDLQTSFKNSISTAEEIATAVFNFFDDIDSKAVINALNEGVLRFGRDQNRLLINVFVSWIKRQFYDIRDFRSYVISQEMLGTLIQLKQNEVKIDIMRWAFFITVGLALTLVFGLAVLGYELSPLAIIGGSIVAAVAMGFAWNKLIHERSELSNQLLNT
ncbi:hypothetical protein SHAb15599_00063 [Acinetobacter phage SH-Ab 15599]|nr:hypothetical protein SHAb15599_00063 [Acinetobacter phage SH-Ab 15599]